MKAVVYHGGTDVRYQEMPLPTVGAGEALVKVAYAGVCGSDVTIYTGKHKRVKPPVVMGHEVSGEIPPTSASEWATGWWWSRWSPAASATCARAACTTPAEA